LGHTVISGLKEPLNQQAITKNQEKNVENVVVFNHNHQPTTNQNHVAPNQSLARANHTDIEDNPKTQDETHELPKLFFRCDWNQ
jgi:hypothetical protein